MARAEIDHDKCVSCGMCLVNCPFAAIADKSQIFQMIHAIKTGEEVYRLRGAPAFCGPVRQEGHSRPDLKAAMRPAGLCRRGGGCHRRRPLHRGGGRRLLGEGPGPAALYGHLLLPGMVRHGQEAVPRALRRYISMAMTPMVHHSPTGPEAEAPRLQDRLHRPLRRQEAGGQPPQRPQRGGLRADL